MLSLLGIDSHKRPKPAAIGVGSQTNAAVAILLMFAISASIASTLFSFSMLASHKSVLVSGAKPFRVTVVEGYATTKGDAVASSSKQVQPALHETVTTDATRSSKQIQPKLRKDRIIIDVVDKSLHGGIANVRNDENLEQTNSRQLDFFIAGFPKCGTTSLLFAFANHNETAVPRREQCVINKGTDKALAEALDAGVSDFDASRSPQTKRGIKCPTSIWNTKGIEKLASYSEHNTKLIIGVRHPVLFFQSFYNYRITEMYDRGTIVKVPPAESLIGVANKWKLVSTDLARFELSMMQLGKTQLSPQQMADLKSTGRQGKTRSPFKVFIYSIEQLADENEARAARFRADMQSFLELNSPIEPFPRGNVNHFVGQQGKPESIDICEPRFNDLRALLVQQGKKSQQWIRSEFMRSEDIFVGGADYFVELIGTWGEDPCQL